MPDPAFEALNGRGKLTSLRVSLAFAVSIVADLVQLPINAAAFTGILALPGEGVDLVVDLVAGVATSALLGFHWALVPTFFAELVPGLDIAPTWTACVAYVVWQRRLEEKANSTPATPVERPLKVVTPPPVDEQPDHRSEAKQVTLTLDEVETRTSESSRPHGRSGL
jgi:hypothetical protein